MSEYGELVNISDLHYAKVTDSATAYSAGTVADLAPAGSISHEAKVNIKTRCYDGKPMFVTVSEGETTVKTTVSGVPARLAAALTGKPYNTAKGALIDTGDASNAPWCAFGGKMEISDGDYRYFWYLKGKFSLGAEEAATKKQGDIDEKTYTLNYTATVTDYQFTDVPNPDTVVGGVITSGVKKIVADSTDTNFTGAATWFNAVQTSSTIGTAPSAVSVTSVPANNGTGVATSAHPALTFNNAIDSEAVTLVKQSDSSVVAVTRAWDAAKKVLTLTPSSSLTSGGVYNIVIAGVIDVYGQALATSVIKFTVS